MSLKCGIVGLPNVGKSTLFNALTEKNVSAANYPFCTIEPNVGVVEVPDERINELETMVLAKKVVRATCSFVDIAGLVKGASAGEGLGNKFLSHIREVDAILHVVRCFEDKEVSHVSGKVDPVEDIEVINLELVLADLTLVEKILTKEKKDPKSPYNFKLLQKLESALNKGEQARKVLTEAELLELKPLNLLTAKPILFVANIMDGPKNNSFLEALANYLKNEQYIVIEAKKEAAVAGFSHQEKVQLLEISSTALDQLIASSYQLLGLQTYFTAGVKEVHAWTVKVGSSAKEAAGVIHTDFAKTFIRAEVISYSDFINYKGEQGAKEAGKMRLEGKDYKVQDGDVIHFRVGA